jgi:hypothetical protein
MKPKGTQLAMFMPAKDLYDMHSVDTPAYAGTDEMRADKRHRNAAGRMNQNIAAEGVRKPVSVFHGSDTGMADYMQGHDTAVGNGNHRVIAAYDRDPGMEVPVIHHDQFGDLMKTMRDQDRAGTW